jgi:tetratricopeptide (TPR) repeat protein
VSPPEPHRPRVAGWLAIHAGCFALAVAILQPALAGPFVSDDQLYANHPYTRQLSLENLLAILDPFGPAKLHTANYEPVHLWLHALERQIFAEATAGYHLVNAWVHALVATLLVALWTASEISLAAALLGALFFLAHPANVEAVAWISQLKTTASLALALGALLCLRRHGALATALLALALLSKASAAFAVPMAAGFAWAWGAREPARRHVAWVAAWAALLAVYALPQAVSFEHLGRVEVEAFSDPWVHLRTIGAVGARYLAMAATSYGVSAFQEPEPARSALDPWWLASLPLGALLAWRLGSALRSRSDEAAYWLGALGAFAPVSQLFPFLNPMADRYLYAMLPGLIGGVLCIGRDAGARLPRRARQAAAAGILSVAALFAQAGFERARLWRDETLLNLDAARHYPEGGSARFLRARAAAQVGDVATAVAELRAASRRGVDNFMVLQSDPGLAPLRGEPAFQELVREVAGRWIERAHERGLSTQAELRFLGLAHLARDELELAVAAFERALVAGGPQQELVAAELEAARALSARGAAEAGQEEDGHGP